MTPPSLRGLVFTWLALLALLAITAGSAFIPMGAWNSVANLLIAALKAALVGFVFMRLSRHGALHRIVTVLALFTLCLLLGITQADYATRRIQPADWNRPASDRTNH